jgi:5-methylcytosine-specific restriction endonuclease McrA
MGLKRRLTGHEKRIVAARGGWKCAICGMVLPATYEVDHVIPLQKGGDDDIANCQALCRSCHGNKTQEEEAERIRTIWNLKNSSSERPPLMCMKCNRIVSPYFMHSCV